MVYLQTSNLKLRTDYAFRHRFDFSHHIATSLIEELKIDLVQQFSLDYLHLVCLGVMKKLLNLWKNGEDKLPLNKIKMISDHLTTLSGTQPDDFQRKARSLNEFGNFKASEFRTFILYTGPVVLKDVLDDEKYQHFMLFHVAIMILCDEQLLLQHIESCKKLLFTFVHNFKLQHHLVYNVHS